MIAKSATTSCPLDIAEIILEILNRGILRIRALSNCEPSKRCFLEADHLHNLPHILSDYRVERLLYYWEMERPSFMSKVPENELRDLAPLWEQLERALESHGILRRHAAAVED
jgi:hypothetical protein